jgi:hypothetical protein
MRQLKRGFLIQREISSNKRLTLIMIAALIAVSLPTLSGPVLAQATCGTAPAPRLTVGQAARVVVSDGMGNNLRVSPNTTAAVAGVLADGEVFNVIGGAQCAENLWWWEVRRWDGTSGWTAEGEPGEYWVEPWPVLDALAGSSPDYRDCDNVPLRL